MDVFFKNIQPSPKRDSPTCIGLDASVVEIPELVFELNAVAHQVILEVIQLVYQIRNFVLILVGDERYLEIIHRAGIHFLKNVPQKYK